MSLQIPQSPQLRFYHRHKIEPNFITKHREGCSSWYHKNRERALQYRREHYRLHADEYKQRSRERYYSKERGRLRTIVLNHYGQNNPRCRCCGESTWEFLTIDHVNGRDGFSHEKRLSGHKMYRWIIKNNFPTGFQILCMNCNSAKGFFGSCPHERSKNA